MKKVIILLMFALSLYSATYSPGDCVVTDEGQKYTVRAVKYEDSGVYACSEDEIYETLYLSVEDNGRRSCLDGSGEYCAVLLHRKQFNRHKTDDDIYVCNRIVEEYTAKSGCKCDNITPPNQYQNLYYSGQSFAELADCENAKNLFDNNNTASCFDAKTLSGNDNACDIYYLYVDCSKPPSEYNGFILFYPYKDESTCKNDRDNYLPDATNCYHKQYCPYFFYAKPDISDCKNVPYPYEYMGFPFAGSFKNFTSCDSSRSYYAKGDGFCIQLDDKCSLYFGYFDYTLDDPDDDNNLTDNDGDGIPDGVLPPDDPDDDPDDHTPDQHDDNNDSIDLNPLLTQIKQTSDRNHKDLKTIKDELDELSKASSKINSKLSDINKNSKDISNKLDKSNNKLDDLIALMHEQNDLLKGNDNGSGDGGINVDMSGVEDRLDETNDHLDHIEQNISSISSLFTSITNLINNPQSFIGDSLTNSIDEISNKYLGKQIINMPECGSIPTYSMHLWGRDIVLLSEDKIDQWPLETFRTMIIFTFVFLGVASVFRGS